MMAVLPNRVVFTCTPDTIGVAPSETQAGPTAALNRAGCNVAPRENGYQFPRAPGAGRRCSAAGALRRGASGRISKRCESLREIWPESPVSENLHELDVVPPVSFQQTRSVLSQGSIPANGGHVVQPAGGVSD